MASRAASRQVVRRSSNARASYIEISRFARTRHHGITPLAARCLSSTPNRGQIQVNEQTKKALESYKSTISPSSKDIKGIAPIQAVEGSALDWANLSSYIGQEITLPGYLGTRRDVSKNLTFTLFQDAGCQYNIQIVSGVKGAVQAHESIKSLKDWTPVMVTAKVKKRASPGPETPEGVYPKLLNAVELELHEVLPLNEITDGLIIKEDAAYPPEKRHLEMRTNSALKHALRFRARAQDLARTFLNEQGLVHIETPLLFKSTPEGAREFLVPTRTKGLAYALPQSPQQFKQILMASGMEAYYQFARCFRDEDLRADRQPEFTQLDIEMGFVDERRIMQVVEQLLAQLLLSSKAITVETPFRRITYREAMSRWGSDKPDVRLGMPIQDISKSLPKDLVSMITNIDNPAIDAFKLVLPDADPKTTRKFVSDFLDSSDGKPFLENPAGQPGVFVVDESKPQKGLAALGMDFVMDTPTELDSQHGELLILQARTAEPFSGGSTPIGNLRLAMHKAAVAQGLLPEPTGFEFLWIVDFPLLSPSSSTEPGQGGQAGLSSTHHPFTAPKTDKDVDLLLTDPTEAIAAHYDIVCNGVELGGGSRRIHNADVQEFVFRDVLKMKEERIEDFRHLLDVLKSGCPPHAGIALGWDRLIAMLVGKDSVRDVIAFPKSGRGFDELVKSPNKVTKEQWDTYHLQVKE